MVLRRLSPDTTLLAVNAPLDAAREAPFAAAVHDVIVRDGCTSLIIVGALRLNVPGDDRLFHLGVAAPGAAPARPARARLASLDARENVAVNDGVIAALVHAARAVGIPRRARSREGTGCRGSAPETRRRRSDGDDGRVGSRRRRRFGMRVRGAGLEATRTWHEDVAAPKHTGRMYT